MTTTEGDRMNDAEYLAYEMHRELTRAEQREIDRRVERARAEREAMTTQSPTRCERCEQPHGTCHHTAPEIAVGDVIHPDMTHGSWSRALALRSNSRAIDPAGNEWVKTRRRDGAWENLTDGAIWPLGHIIDARQGYGPLTVEHVAGGAEVTCSNCGTYARHSDRTGCCDSCGRLFKGLGAFDRHWTTPAPGERACVDPLTVHTGDGEPVYETTEVPGGIAYRFRTDDSHWEKL